MKRLVSVACLFAAVVPCLAYGSSALGLNIRPFLAAVSFLCPSYVLFAATAACAPLDWCSLHMLAWVVAGNVALYGLVALALTLTRRHFQIVGIIVLCAVLTFSGWVTYAWFG
jgi:hypothetical protein